MDMKLDSRERVISVEHAKKQKIERLSKMHKGVATM